MTYIYETLNTSNMADRLYRDDNAGWSYEGAKALAEYVEQLAEDIGEPIEFDYVALRCEYTEYSDLEAFNNCYHGKGHEDAFFQSIEDVQNETTVIMVGVDGLIVQEF